MEPPRHFLQFGNRRKGHTQKKNYNKGVICWMAHMNKKKNTENKKTTNTYKGFISIAVTLFVVVIHLLAPAFSPIFSFVFSVLFPKKNV